MNQLSNIYTFASHRKANSKLRHFALGVKPLVRQQEHRLVCQWIDDEATGKLCCKWSADDACGDTEAEPILRLAG